jgi:hypothetical protein
MRLDSLQTPDQRPLYTVKQLHAGVPYPNESNSLFKALTLPSRVVLHLSNLITGSGLGVLLSLAAADLDPLSSVFAVSVGALISLLWGCCIRQASPAWLCLCSSTLNLILTLSVALSLFARLCPSEGKELALIPAYFLLCVSRLRLAVYWPVRAINALFLAAFVVLTLLDTQEPGFVGFESTDSDEILTFAWISGAVVCDALSQWCRLSEELVHSQRCPEFHVSCLGMEAGLWGLPRYLLLYLVSQVGGGALPYLFLAPLPTYSNPSTPDPLGACYGFVLLLSAMCIASAWFQCLQCLSNSPHKLPRLQHIFNLLLVGAAWAFPINQPELALVLFNVAGLSLVLGSLLSAPRPKHLQP